MITKYYRLYGSVDALPEIRCRVTGDINFTTLKRKKSYGSLGTLMISLLMIIQLRRLRQKAKKSAGVFWTNRS